MQVKRQYADRVEAAIGLCEVVGLDASDVRSLTLNFDADGDTFIAATILPRYDRLAEFVRRIPIFIQRPQEIIPITETIERLDRVIANVRRYQ